MIPVLPAVSLRDALERSFAEVSTCLGPEAIGVTGDNSYRTLYGRPYALVLEHETRVLRLFRGATGGGAYEEVTSALPAILFGPVYPEDARRFSAAFDQSARLVVAYELEGETRVTRWTGAEYVQNVTLAGVDPALIMDATLADPRGYPNLADDGWSVREAFEAGIRVTFEWLAGDPVVWLENAIPDSDVLLFYLTPDRLELRVRVQRQLYATPITVHTFAEPVILDRAIALLGRYQLLVSDALGDPLAEMLVSAPYIGDFLIEPELEETLGALVTPETIVAEQEVVEATGEDELAASIAPEAIATTGDTAFTTGDEQLETTVEPESIVTVGSVAPTSSEEALDATVAPEGTIPVITVVEVSSSSEALDASIEPEAIRVQTV